MFIVKYLQTEPEQSQRNMKSFIYWFEKLHQAYQFFP